MGLKIHRPRRGSMGYYPRKRAKSIVPHVRTWPDVSLGRPILLGFSAYKVGMAHAVIVDDRPTSPLYGKEVVKAVTILESPPMRVLAARFYSVDPTNGYRRTIGEVWASEIPKQVLRVVTLPERINSEEMLKRVEDKVDLITEVRLLLSTQPWMSGIGKKTPELLEIPVGGTIDVEEKYKFSLSLLGKELNVDDVFREGQLVDVVAITKGKGFAGVVKRFGVTILPRWHKHRKGHRRTGTIGPQKPAVMFTTPRAGQLGFHQRTEYNKRILKIGLNGAEITPSSGFKHYGVIKGPYLVVLGSVPGPPKRLVVLRHPARPPPKAVTTKPQLIWVSTQPLSL